ncbi:PAAR domain-containing protein [Pseudomonas sp. BJa5]|uniref:PAAR domain-containing protein n=1 Tax=Pseudomonas sp. BJa5 TaxID=2936270 RepID=UPI002559AC28|nr:PAAR domain-containing protein [Pseudomonas sp. BGr12]MDL2423472.1 PAAR domain-containing protein [Pseudomonas sp. BGr12]
MGKRSNMFGRGEGLHGDKTTTGATCISSLPQAAHGGRGVLRKGDVTTECPKCGQSGKIAEGDSRFTFHGKPVAVDGMLVACGCPPGSNRLIAPLGDWIGPDRPSANRAAEPASRAPTASPPPSSSGFSPANHASPTMSAAPGTLEPGFYVVPRSMSGQQVLAQLGGETRYLSARLHRLNPTFAQGFKAGELFVIGDPHNGTACTREEADLMAAAARVREVLAPLTEDEANFMARYQGEIAGVLDGASESMGVGQSMLKQGLRQVEGTLHAVEQLYQRSFITHGNLKSPEFFASRQQVLRQLDGQLRGSFLNKALNLGSYDVLRRDLGISTKSLVHHWSRAGAPGQIPGYATHLDQVAKTAKYLKYGGYVGVALGGGASVLKVQEVCRAGETEECKRIRFTEAGSFTGGLGVGSLGGYAGGKVAMAVCGFAAAAGPVGVAVCGVVLVGGGSLAGGVGGGSFGEWVGDILYEVQSD